MCTPTRWPTGRGNTWPPCRREMRWRRPTWNSTTTVRLSRTVSGRQVLKSAGSKLADQKADLERKKVGQAPVDEPELTITTPPPPIVGLGLRKVSSPPTQPESPSLAQIRQDLAKAQQERGELQRRLDATLRELETLKTKAKLDGRHMAQLTASVSQLTTKLRDRDEELRGKAKLVEHALDEHVTLNLQLNMAEEQTERLRKENQELVDRWMARMGKEADRMNDENELS